MDSSEAGDRPVDDSEQRTRQTTMDGVVKRKTDHCSLGVLEQQRAGSEAVRSI